MTDIQLLAVLAAILKSGSYAQTDEYAKLTSVEAVNEALLVLQAAREKLK